MGLLKDILPIFVVSLSIGIVLGLVAMHYDVASATGYVVRSPATVNPAHGDVTVIIPPHAIEVAPDVFDLGTAIHNGEEVQGLMIVDRQGYGHKPRHGRGGGGKGGGEKCFAFLSRGAKWLQAEPYLLNTVNADGLYEGSVASSIFSAIESWDSQTSSNIFGIGSVTGDTLVADTIAPDNKNEVYFGAIDGADSIAVTIVWGIFGGPPRGRKLVEWDMVFDDAEFTFGDADLDSSVMDLSNIATHEAGHAGGLDHPDDGCTEETMYRFADFGETKKRSLNPGDIAGVRDLYK